MKKLVLKKLSLVPNAELRQILGGHNDVTPEPGSTPTPEPDTTPGPGGETPGCKRGCNKNNHCQNNS